MRRSFALITTLFQLLGMVGVPAVAYTCLESGENGIISLLSWSPGSCYVEVCCDDDQDVADARLEGTGPCCDSDIQIAKSRAMFLLDHKYGQGGPLPQTQHGLDAAHVDSRTVAMSPTRAIFDPPINPPLLI